MSRLDELIQELCPNGVEYKKLSKLTKIERGKRVVKKQLSQDSGFPVFQNSLTPMGYHVDSNYPAETTFIIGAGSAGEIGYSKENFWAADDCFPIVCSDSVINRYIFHFLLKKRSVLLSKVRKSSIPRLSRTVIENLMIPVPPLKVQEEIVRILDKFTTLEAELTAELTARKKQYEYYRRKLLTFGEDIPVFQIKEIGTVSIGEFVHKSKQNPNAQYPVFNGGISNTGFYNDFNRTANKVIISARGANAGFVNRVFTNFWSGNSCYTIDIPNGKVDWNYAYFWMKSNETKLLGDQQKGGIPAISKKQVEEFQIPVPPIEEQHRIVSILDKFDMLATSISEGLPKEIELRRKQYEYYRNQLLSFPDNKATA